MSWKSFAIAFGVLIAFVTWGVFVSGQFAGSDEARRAFGRFLLYYATAAAVLTTVGVQRRNGVSGRIGLVVGVLLGVASPLYLVLFR